MNGLSHNNHGQRSRIIPVNSQSRGATSTRAQNRSNDSRLAATRGSNTLGVSDRSSNKPGNRFSRKSAERPTLEFRQRDKNTYSASGVSRLDRGQSNTPRQSTNRSSTPKGNSEAIRLRARESSTTLRSAARSSAPQRMIQKQPSKSTAKGGKRSSLEVNNQRPVVQISNRQTLARVNSPSQQAPARYQPRASSSGRTAARNSRAQARSHRRTNRMNGIDR